MAKLITREFKTYEVTVTGVDKATHEPAEGKFTFFDSLPNTEEKIMKEVRRRCEGLDFAPAFILTTEEKSEIRGMEKEKFYEESKPVERPASQRKENK